MNDEDRGRVMEIVLQLCPQILVCGWWSLEEDVAWYAIWRDRHQDRLIDTYATEVARGGGAEFHVANGDAQSDARRPRPPRYLIKPLAEGELFALEAEQAVCRKLKAQITLRFDWYTVLRLTPCGSGINRLTRQH